ncbi:hypothetical protein D3C85_367940 [compost metagenome]
MRRQHFLRAAVGQHDFLLHQPDDIAGQPRHLLRCQRNTGTKVPLLGKGNALIHQGLVLLFVIAVVTHETLSRQRGHLFAHQALLVETVAQALLRHGRIAFHLAEQIVGTRPFPIAGKARIRFHQIAGRWRRTHFIQAGVRNLQR